MNDRWTKVAERTIDALGVRTGEVIQLRDRTGRFDVVQEMLLAIERRGATPLPQLLPPGYLRRLLSSTSPAMLRSWDQRRLAWTSATDRVLVLAGPEEDLSAAPVEAVDAWSEAVHRLTLDEEQRCVPTLLAAVPTMARAEQLGMSLDALEDLVVPALMARPSELQHEVERVLSALEGARALTVRSHGGYVLQLEPGGRRWLSDTGVMPAAETLPPGTQAVLNLPAGAVYSTVVEAAASGALWLPAAGEARDVTLRFEHGRVAEVEAAHGAAELDSMFDSHTGEPRRISHLGIGLNLYLQRPVGWTLVDEHCHGALLIAFGENRYLGGENASSLNVDFAIPNADLLADGRAIVVEGRLVV